MLLMQRDRGEFTLSAFTKVRRLRSESECRRRSLDLLSVMFLD